MVTPTIENWNKMDLNFEKPTYFSIQLLHINSPYTQAHKCDETHRRAASLL